MEIDTILKLIAGVLTGFIIVGILTTTNDLGAQKVCKQIYNVECKLVYQPINEGNPK